MGQPLFFCILGQPASKYPACLSQNADMSVIIFRMEEKELENIVMRLRPKMRFFALRMIGDPSMSEDMVQDAILSFMKVFRSKGRRPDNPEAFLMKIVRNRCLDHIRHSSVVTSVPLDAAASKAGVPQDRLQECRDQVELVHKAVAKLGENYKTVFILRDMLGYDMDEIAHIMGAGGSAVRKMLSRARKLIRDEFTD